MRKNGEQFPAEISLAPMNADGRSFVVAAVRDVTQRKAIERRAHLYEKARHDVQLRDEFLSIASHDFRTPISALAMQTKLLPRAVDRAGSEPLASQRERITSIHRQTSRLVQLVDGLLDVTQVAAGRLVLRPEPLDLADLVRDAAERWRDTAASANCAIEVRTPPSIPGRWDRMRLEQIVDNLVSNALKYGAGKPVQIAAEADDSAVQLTVRDEGIGNADGEKGRLFEKFERTGAARARFRGLGLGLWIVRSIVEAHGGEIRVSSQPNRGSECLILLPREAFDDDVPLGARAAPSPS